MSSYSKTEVDLARAIFKKWLNEAKKKGNPESWLVEQFRKSGIVGSTNEPGEQAVYRWTFAGGIIFCLGEDYRTVLWSRTVERMAEAALSKNIQLELFGGQSANWQSTRVE